MALTNRITKQGCQQDNSEKYTSPKVDASNPPPGGVQQRKSSRQRILSTRLHDMEVNFGSPSGKKTNKHDKAETENVTDIKRTNTPKKLESIAIGINSRGDNEKERATNTPEGDNQKNGSSKRQLLDCSEEIKSKIKKTTPSEVIIVQVKKNYESSDDNRSLEESLSVNTVKETSKVFKMLVSDMNTFDGKEVNSIPAEMEETIHEDDQDFSKKEKNIIFTSEPKEPNDDGTHLIQKEKNHIMFEVTSLSNIPMSNTEKPDENVPDTSEKNILLHTNLIDSSTDTVVVSEDGNANVISDNVNIQLTDHIDTDNDSSTKAVVVIDNGKELVLNLKAQDISLSNMKVSSDQGTDAISQKIKEQPNIKFITLNEPPITLSEADGESAESGISKTYHVVLESEQQVQPEGQGPMYISVGDNLFACSDCDYKTTKRGNWYKHRRKHTGGKMYPCELCQYQATSSSNLTRHMTTHNNIRKYKCEICEDAFRQKIHLERHIRYRHEEKQVKCKLCDYTCANETPDLKMHMRRKHLTTSDEDAARLHFRCQDCGFVAGSKRDLVQHLKFHKQGPELKLYCEHCSFVTDCESRLARHGRIHNKEKPFQCGYCEYRATQKSHILRHMAAKHNVEVPPARAYTRRSESEEGEELGTMKKKKYQPADFSNREKVFSCAHCTMRFAKLINLYKHLKVQHKELHMPGEDGIHSCIICEYRTTKKKNLLVHMRKHSQRENDVDASKPYTCVFCNYSNVRRKNLYTHMRKKHKMHIIIKPDGSASCVIDNDLAGIDSEEGRKALLGAGITELATLPVGMAVSAINENIDIVASAAGSEETSIVGPQPAEITPNTQMVMVELEPGMPATAVEINVPPHNSSSVPSGTMVDTEAADAIQGLQALAGQQVQQQVAIDKDEVLANQQAVIATDAPQANIHLSEEQLMHLSSGDYIEINGEMYKVEFTE